MRWLLAFGVTTLILAAGVWYQTTKPPSEGGMECHGVPRGNRCVQFPPDQRVAQLVAGFPVVRRDAPLMSVRCYSKGTLAVCDSTLKHGSLGVENARFRIHPDGSVTPICPGTTGKHTVSVFCTS
jgi:hypothetical protein